MISLKDLEISSVNYSAQDAPLSRKLCYQLVLGLAKTAIRSAACLLERTFDVWVDNLIDEKIPMTQIMLTSGNFFTGPNVSLKGKTSLSICKIHIGSVHPREEKKNPCLTVVELKPSTFHFTVQCMTTRPPATLNCSSTTVDITTVSANYVIS